MDNILTVIVALGSGFCLGLVVTAGVLAPTIYASRRKDKRLVTSGPIPEDGYQTTYGVLILKAYGPSFRESWETARKEGRGIQLNIQKDSWNVSSSYLAANGFSTVSLELVLPCVSLSD